MLKNRLQPNVASCRQIRPYFLLIMCMQYDRLLPYSTVVVYREVEKRRFDPSRKSSYYYQREQLESYQERWLSICIVCVRYQFIAGRLPAIASVASDRQPIGQLEFGDGRTLAEIWRVKFSCFDIILSLEHSSLCIVLDIEVSR